MTVKQCSKCKETKALEEFNKHNRRLDGRQNYCRKCSLDNSKRNYAVNPGVKERQLELNAYVRARNKRLVQRYKSFFGCRICDEKSYVALDLHHLSPEEKDADVSTLLESTKKLKAEIRKCAILCANCHRKVHAGLLTLGV